MILINQIVSYSKTNPKLLPAMFLFNQLLRSRSQVKGQDGENSDTVMMISPFLTEINHQTRVILIYKKSYNLLELQQNILNDLEHEF